MESFAPSRRRSTTSSAIRARPRCSWFLKQSESSWVLSVIDNGRGFEFVGGSPGQDGLAGLCQRMQQLGGNFQIARQPGSGTKIEIRIPLNWAQHGRRSKSCADGNE